MLVFNLTSLFGTFALLFYCIYLITHSVAAKKQGKNNPTQLFTKWVFVVAIFFHFLSVWVLGAYDFITQLNIVAVFISLTSLFILWYKQYSFYALLSSYISIGCLLLLAFLFHRYKAIEDTATLIHALTSLFAMGILLTCLLIVFFGHLKNKSIKKHHITSINSIIPPLDFSKKILIFYSWIGFVILVIALFQGFLILEDIKAQHQTHKIFFSFVALIFFGYAIYLLNKKSLSYKKLMNFFLVANLMLFVGYFGTSIALQFILD